MNDNLAEGCSSCAFRWQSTFPRPRCFHAEPSLCSSDAELMVRPSAFTTQLLGAAVFPNTDWSQRNDKSAPKRTEETEDYSSMSCSIIFCMAWIFWCIFKNNFKQLNKDSPLPSWPSTVHTLTTFNCGFIQQPSLFLTLSYWRLLDKVGKWSDYSGL